MTLNDINKCIANCTSCNLYESRHFTVPGEGPTNAKLMIIGEGPGEQNDLYGRPFIGRGGQLLDKFLKDTGINREEIFLTNIIKCRMPHNATPSKQIVDQCICYLKQQIEIIQPTVIISLGVVASKWLSDNKTLKLKDVHTKKMQYHNCTLLCTYHPSSIRYNKEASNMIIETLKLAKIICTSD